MDEAGALQPLPPSREQAVDVLGGLGAALNGKARRLVEDQDLIVLVEHHRLGIDGVTPVEHLARARNWGFGQRRNADLCSGG